MKFYLCSVDDIVFCFDNPMYAVLMMDDDDERLISCPILMPFILSNKKILRNMLITVPCGF